MFKYTVFKKAFSTTTAAASATLSHLSGAHAGVALVEIDNPSSRNALSKKFIHDLKEIIETLKVNRDVRVAILRSKSPGMFCAGADLKERSKMTDDESEQFVITLRNTFDDFYNLPVPTIACIDGAALGGGLELALSCDMRIATKSSLIGLTETGLAIIPGAGGTQKLSRLIGLGKAKELIFTARRLSALEALNLGILNYVEESYEKAFEKSAELATQILKCGPLAIRLAKQALNAGYETDLKTGLEIEKMCYAKIVGTEDRIEGMKAFVEKRKPVYKGK